MKYQNLQDQGYIKIKLKFLSILRAIFSLTGAEYGDFPSQIKLYFHLLHTNQPHLIQCLFSILIISLILVYFCIDVIGYEMRIW